MLQHLEWGAEGEGDYFLFSIHSLKMRSKEFFQRFYGQIIKSMSCERADFAHIFSTEGAESQITVFRQETMTAGEELLRIIESLQGRAGSD